MKIDAVAQDESPVTRAAARTEFHAEVTYLDTASFGLPPRRSWMVRQHALAQWRAGIADPVTYDLPLAAARSSYAHLAGMDPSLVAMGSQVSVFARLIAANLPDDSEVLTATGDFTSILFPFYAQSGRGICIRGGAAGTHRGVRDLGHHADRGLRGTVRGRSGRRRTRPAATSPGVHAVPAPARPRPSEPVPRRNGMAPTDSAIVLLAPGGAAADAMTAARITGSARADRLRLSFHVSTSDQDADLAAGVLRRHVTSRHPATL